MQGMLLQIYKNYSCAVVSKRTRIHTDRRAGQIVKNITHNREEESINEVAVNSENVFTGCLSIKHSKGGGREMKFPV